MPDLTAADYLGPGPAPGLSPDVAPYCPAPVDRVALWRRLEDARIDADTLVADIGDQARNSVIGVAAVLREVLEAILTHLGDRVLAVRSDLREITAPLEERLTRDVLGLAGLIPAPAPAVDIGRPRPIVPSLHPGRVPVGPAPAPGLPPPPGGVGPPPGGLPLPAPPPESPLRLPPPPPPITPPPPPSETVVAPPPPLPGADIGVSPWPGEAPAPPTTDVTAGVTCPPSRLGAGIDVCEPHPVYHAVHHTEVPYYPAGCAGIDWTSEYARTRMYWWTQEIFPLDQVDFSRYKEQAFMALRAGLPPTNLLTRSKDDWLDT